MNTKVSVSILGADISRLADEVKRVENSGADMLHFDVMDGIFVDNISFGLPVLDAVNKCTDMILDVHLMIAQPDKYIESFAKAGADIITFHLESKSDIKETINKINTLGIKAGLSIKPSTPVKAIYPYLEAIDLVLVMSVEPGFGGQGFMENSLLKVNELRDIKDEQGYLFEIEIDGGINARTAQAAVRAGADILVSGSYLFSAEDMKNAVDGLKKFR